MITQVAANRVKTKIENLAHHDPNILSVGVVSLQDSYAVQVDLQDEDMNFDDQEQLDGIPVMVRVHSIVNCS